MRSCIFIYFCFSSSSSLCWLLLGCSSNAQFLQFPIYIYIFRYTTHIYSTSMLCYIYIHSPFSHRTSLPQHLSPPFNLAVAVSLSRLLFQCPNCCHPQPLLLAVHQPLTPLAPPRITSAAEVHRSRSFSRRVSGHSILPSRAFPVVANARPRGDWRGLGMVPSQHHSGSRTGCTG